MLLRYRVKLLFTCWIWRCASNSYILSTTFT